MFLSLTCVPATFPWASRSFQPVRASSIASGKWSWGMVRLVACLPMGKAGCCMRLGSPEGQAGERVRTEAGRREQCSWAVFREREETCSVSHTRSPCREWWASRQSGQWQGCVHRRRVIFAVQKTSVCTTPGVATCLQQRPWARSRMMEQLTVPWELLAQVSVVERIVTPQKKPLRGSPELPASPFLKDKRELRSWH